MMLEFQNYSSGLINLFNNETEKQQLTGFLLGARVVVGVWIPVGIKTLGAIPVFMEMTMKTAWIRVSQWLTMDVFSLCLCIIALNALPLLIVFLTVEIILEIWLSLYRI